jgi:hypothetical protein
MKKTNNKVVKNTTAISELKKLTRPELLARFKGNVSERKRLSAENKLLIELYKKLSTRKRKSVIKKQAKKK